MQVLLGKCSTELLLYHERSLKIHFGYIYIQMKIHFKSIQVNKITQISKTQNKIAFTVFFVFVRII